jgi:ribonuclease Z
LTFTLKILGSNSAAPAHTRNQTSQLLVINNYRFLIDCGEGTQMQLTKYNVKLGKIDHVFISHLHGDHFFGLMGLISTMHLFRRSKELHIYGPPDLAEIIIANLKYSKSYLNFKIVFHPLENDNPELIYENEILTVHTIPLSHGIRCNGFLFKEKQKPKKINKEKLPEGFSLKNIARLKKGLDIEDETGNVIYKNEELTLPEKKSYSYAYCSDTIYDEDLIPLIRNVDLLYHESTFATDMEQRANETFHSTARQAAIIAAKANVSKLILGHYSVRYKDLQPLLDEAKAIFNETILAKEGENIVLEH